MDPLSPVTSVVGLLETTSKLSATVSRFRHDIQAADGELDAAKKHVLPDRDINCQFGASRASNIRFLRLQSDEPLDPDGLGSFCAPIRNLRVITSR